MTQGASHTTTRDMTEGFIPWLVLQYALPLMVGNVFQMLYNTVDSIVVGRYVGTEALAAVGSTTMIINMAVLFFNGFSVGASVVIGRSFGAKDMDKLHTAVETTMAMTFGLCALITALGVVGVSPLLRLMSTPEDVFEDAALYLRIYFAGIAGLLIYNMGGGILRAVGDTTRPLYFLIFTCVLNIGLDLLFVISFRWGIAGVAYATVLSQFVSAALVLWILTVSRDVYRLTWRDLRLDRAVFRRIFSIGLPTAVQSVITQFSNVFVQSYVNSFGSASMAGWGCYNKLEQFIFLPIQSMSVAATTFVSQNLGAKKQERVERGALMIVGLCLAITALFALPVFIFAEPAVRLFTADLAVISLGILFIRTNTLYILANAVNHVMAGVLRGMGDSKAPMIIMLLNFVAVRQLYLYLVTHYIANTPTAVALSYPFGWVGSCVMEIFYYFMKRRHPT